MTAWELMDTLGGVEDDLIRDALEAPPRRRHGKALRAALIAAAVLLLLALAALAASETGLLASLFSGKYSLIEDYVSHVEAVAENEKLRLTLHEAVTDGSCAAVIFSVERLDGGSLAGWRPEAEILPLDGAGTPLRSGASVTDGLETEAATDCHRWFLWFTYGRTGLARVSLNLNGMINRTTEQRLDCAALTVEADLTPCPVKLGKRGGDPEAKELYPSIVLSPLSLSVLCQVNVAGMEPGSYVRPERVHNGEALCTVELLFRDGSLRDISAQVARRIVTLSTGDDLLTCIFGELLEIGSVRAVRIDGMDYPLEEGQAPEARESRLTQGASWEDNALAWTFGDHVPAYPVLTDDSGEVALSLRGIWTDGYTTELRLKVDGERSQTLWEPVNAGGSITLRALDADGAPLAVGVTSGGAWEGTVSLVAECSGKAATLTLGDLGSELTIPLDMKTLRAMPQVEAP